LRLLALFEQQAGIAGIEHDAILIVSLGDE
jgi:hypothetical protein